MRVHAFILCCSIIYSILILNHLDERKYIESYAIEEVVRTLNVMEIQSSYIIIQAGAKMKIYVPQYMFRVCTAKIILFLIRSLQKLQN